MNGETVTVSMTKELKEFCVRMGKLSAVSAGVWIRQLLNEEMKGRGKAAVGFAA